MSFTWCRTYNDSEGRLLIAEDDEEERLNLKEFLFTEEEEVKSVPIIP